MISEETYLVNLLEELVNEIISARLESDLAASEKAIKRVDGVKIQIIKLLEGRPS